MTSRWLGDSESPSRKGKGLATEPSDYVKLAQQGGHRDLLVIEDNKPSPEKKQVQRKGGDWFAHESNGSAQHDFETPEKSKPDSIELAKQKAASRSVGDILPGGCEQSQKFGRKPFFSPAKEAPFGLNY